MILQALNQYYERLKENSGANIPLYGFSREKIHFVLEIDRNGKLLGDPFTNCIKSCLGTIRKV